eukprot:60659_1
MVHETDSIYSLPDLILCVICTALQIILSTEWVYHMFVTPSIRTRSIFDAEMSIRSKSNSKPNNQQSPNSTTTKAIECSISQKAQSIKSQSIQSQSIKSQSHSSDTTEKEIYQQIKSIPKQFKLFSTLSVFLSLTYAMFLGGLYLIQLIIKHSMPCKMWCLGILWLSSHRICIYFYYIARLELTFRGTDLEISKKKLLFIRMWIVIGMIISIIFWFYWNILNNCNTISMIISLTPWSAVDSISSFLCLFLMVYKLKKLFKHSASEKNMRDVKYLINKFSILTAVTIGSTFILQCIFLVLPLVAIAPIDMMTNTLCLMLSFAHYDFYYRKLCIGCIKCCDYSKPKPVINYSI